MAYRCGNPYWTLCSSKWHNCPRWTTSNRALSQWSLCHAELSEPSDAMSQDSGSTYHGDILSNQLPQFIRARHCCLSPLTRSAVLYSTTLLFIFKSLLITRSLSCGKSLRFPSRKDARKNLILNNPFGKPLGNTRRGWWLSAEIVL